MDRLTTPVRKQEDRLQGRLVEIDSQMYLVTKVDAHTGFATLSFGTAQARRTLYMPIPEVFYWLAQKTREEDTKPDQQPPI